jgi:hypothetical protein
LAAGHIQSRGNGVDREHTTSALQERAGDCELPYWSTAEHRDGLTWMDLGQLRPNQPVGKISDSMIACSSVTSSGSFTRPMFANGIRARSACKP